MTDDTTLKCTCTNKSNTFPQIHEITCALSMTASAVPDPRANKPGRRRDGTIKGNLEKKVAARTKEIAKARKENKPLPLPEHYAASLIESRISKVRIIFLKDLPELTPPKPEVNKPTPKSEVTNEKSLSKSKA